MDDNQIDSNVGVEKVYAPYPFSQPSKQISNVFLKSIGSWQVITEFLNVSKTLQLQECNKFFYDHLIPSVMYNRHLFPSVNPQMHLYIHNQCLWGIKLPSKSITREVDFEEDEWIHDNQHVLLEEGHQWPEKLIDFKTLGKNSGDSQLEIGAREDVLIQYIFQIAKDKFIVFPLTDTVLITRGLIIELGDRTKKEEPTVRKTAPVPRELIRSGVLPQKTKGQITDILLCGGNEDKQCHSYNIDQDVWTVAGVLPNLHTVTEQIMVQYQEKQTITLFVMINFEANCFQLNSAFNTDNVRTNPSTEEWKWLAKMDLDIENFHIKCAFFHENKHLVIFARGKPKDVLEVCCSFFLIFDLIIEGGQLKGIDPAYRHIKLDPLSYAEFQAQPQLAKQGDHLVVRMPQEDSHAEGFPRQLLEFTIPDADFTKTHDLNVTEFQKLVTMEFTERKDGNAP